MPMLSILAAFALFAASARADDVADARGFLQAAAQQVRADAAQGEERQRFAAVLDRDFDVRAMGAFVLGRYWSSASDQARHDFVDAFRAYLAKSYAKRFFVYAGRPMTIVSAHSAGTAAAMVRTNVLEADNREVGVDWQLSKADGGWRIVDVVVEGVSMGQTQRADFGSVLQSSNGDLGKLTAMLRQRSQ